MPSINEELDAFPVLREYTHDVKGMVLCSPRTEIVFVPIEMTAGQSWHCVVVWSPEGSAYPRGGYDISVGHKELQRCYEIPMHLVVHYCGQPLRYVLGVDPADPSWFEVSTPSEPGTRIYSMPDTLLGGNVKVDGLGWMTREDYDRWHAGERILETD